MSTVWPALIESLGNFRQAGRFHDAKFCVRVGRHGEHLVAAREAFHSGPNLDDSPRKVDSHQSRKLDGIEVFR
jgi:hypothetical protein